MALTDLGALSRDEQAGERMKLGRLRHDPEEEHECFSDNNHNSHFHDGLGLRNLDTGRQGRVDGSVGESPSLHDLVPEIDRSVGTALLSDLNTTMIALGDLRSVAEAGTSCERLLGIGAPVAQTRTIERAAALVDLEGVSVEGSTPLDDPSTVLQ